MSIRSALLTRNNITTQHTDKIFGMYGELFSSIFDKLINSKMSIKWVSIDFHPLNTKFLILIGIAKYNIGQTIKLENDMIFVDSTNVDNYARGMRIMLPCDPIDNNDIDSVMTFLEEYAVLASHADADAIDALLGDNEFLESTFSLYKKSNSPNKIMYDEFDLTNLNLDDIQLQQLKFTKQTGNL